MTNAELLDNLIARNNGVVDDWDIVEKMDDDDGENWDCMCSDISIEMKDETLAAANKFLSDYGSAYRVINVECVDGDAGDTADSYTWSFEHI